MSDGNRTVDRLVEAMRRAAGFEDDTCVHCNGKRGSHMRWCSSEGPLYESRYYEALAVALTKAGTR